MMPGVMTQKDVFNGRVIFDHLPKTAGTAVNFWLQEKLGSGCVTDKVEGWHESLVESFGGRFSLISGHLYFSGEGLDPRYSYMTLMREPLDRILSYIFFVLEKETEGPVPGWCRMFFPWLKEFIDSDGKYLDVRLLDYISNTYTNHFWSIRNGKRPAVSEANKVTAALDIIKFYDVVGLYEEMPEFLTDVAELIGIPAPEEIERVNVTRSRPSVDRISPELRQRIIELNQLDIHLYEEVVRWKKSQPVKKREPVTVSRWEKYDSPPRTHDSERVFTTPDLSDIRAKFKEGEGVPHGSVMTFEVDFTLNRPIEHELEAGIHIFDEENKLAYGSNSVLMGKNFRNLSPGTHRITHYVAADLPVGRYTAGFAFAEKMLEEVKQLAWHGKLCSFDVTQDRGGMSVGYAALPAEMTLESV